MRACSPIAIVTNLDELESNMSKRLVSSLQAWVDGCEAFDKLIEVVSPQGTVEARQRWKRYAQMGVALSNTAVNQ